MTCTYVKRNPPFIQKINYIILKCCIVTFIYFLLWEPVIFIRRKDSKVMKLKYSVSIVKFFGSMFMVLRLHSCNKGKPNRMEQLIGTINRSEQHPVYKNRKKQFTVTYVQNFLKFISSRFSITAESCQITILYYMSYENICVFWSNGVTFYWCILLVSKFDFNAVFLVST